MENFEPKVVPQFKSAEEEVAFLRAHLAEQEKAMAERGVEASREQLASDTIRAYQGMSTRQVLAPAAQLPTAEKEGLVLRLKPEQHDAVMEELLGILLDRGIKNALDVAEAAVVGKVAEVADEAAAKVEPAAEDVPPAPDPAV